MRSSKFCLRRATAVHQAYPSFRRLYAHLKRSEAEGGRPEGCLAELRVQGGKRLGPARAKRLARVLMATESRRTISYFSRSENLIFILSLSERPCRYDYGLWIFTVYRPTYTVCSIKCVPLRREKNFISRYLACIIQ